MENVLYGCSYIIEALFELYVISKFMNLFLGSGKREKRILAVAYIFRFILCTVQYVFMPHVLLNMLVGVSTLFIITMCYGGKIANKSITVILIYACVSASEIVIGGVLVLADKNILVSGHNGDAFSYIGVSIILWVIYEIVQSFKNINSNTVLPKTFDIIIVILSIIILAMETVIFIQDDIMDSIKVISVICMLLVLFLMIYLYDVISKYYVDRIQTELLEREKNYYHRQAELLEQSNKEIRNLSHDMKNHLYAISSLINEDNKEAKKYIDSITEKLEINEVSSNTGNIALDSVINCKVIEAGKMNVRISTNITIPSNIQEGVEDLVTIIGNLLDNAIEASENVAEDRYIEMKIKYKRGTMFIDVKNRYDGIVNQKNGEITTKKADKEIHGIGLESVKAVVDKYEGTMRIDFDEKEFRVNVMLFI